ncbi:MAG: prolyl aminopeptidase [Rhodovibrionaceae bacterium]
MTDPLAQKRDFWPAIEPYNTGRLKVSDQHELYYEESGNPDGVPVVYLHGGPGYGSSPTGRRFFDPAHYRIVVFDQRGCGQSTPLGEIRDNTTTALVEDMEKLREMLEIDRWMLFGGSWGATLGIAYAQAHPKRVLTAVLRGIFLASKAEVDWFVYGVRQFYPEPWEEFASFVPEEERDDLLTAYAKRLESPDPELRKATAIAWSRYEGCCATLLPSEETVSGFEDETVAVGLARMETSYFLNEIYLPPNHLMDNMHRMADVPGVMVQGRYDMPCPPHTAMAVHRRWPASKLIIVPDAGHMFTEPGIRDALLNTMDELKSVRL